MSEAGPRLLILDTSGRGGVVAVARGGRVVGEQRLDESRRQARDLVPATSRLLSAQGWRPRDLEGVVVGLGPGSYTGLRVGLIAARALAYATGCALVGVETFAVIAGQAPPDAAFVDVLADAQQERVYVQTFRRDESGMEATAPLRICELDEWLTTRDPAAQLSGPGVEAYPSRLGGLKLIDAVLRVPSAEGLLRVGLPRWLRGERDDVWSLEPIYLRPSAAEQQWQKASRGRQPPEGGADPGRDASGSPTAGG
jgi:tRNA threonylcarbamoyladenosine biosynthesis protein TsaB